MKPIKPSNEQLKNEYKQMLALVEHNGSRPAKCNPVTAAAKQFGYTRAGIARLMNGKVDNWKPQHFAIYEFLKNYLPVNQQVNKIVENIIRR
jgi:hypothetical protein